MSGPIAVIGAGLIGRGWAIVFARAGRTVALYDPVPAALERARVAIDAALADLAGFALIEDPAPIAARITAESDLERALAGAGYVQECGPEVLETKRALFAALDRHADAAAVLEARQQWRDRRLMALIAHKRAAAREIGE